MDNVVLKRFSSESEVGSHAPFSNELRTYRTEHLLSKYGFWPDTLIAILEITSLLLLIAFIFGGSLFSFWFVTIPFLLASFLGKYFSDTADPLIFAAKGAMHPTTRALAPMFQFLPFFFTAPLIIRHSFEIQMLLNSIPYPSNILKILNSEQSYSQHFLKHLHLDMTCVVLGSILSLFVQTIYLWETRLNRIASYFSWFAGIADNLAVSIYVCIIFSYTNHSISLYRHLVLSLPVLLMAARGLRVFLWLIFESCTAFTCSWRADIPRHFLGHYFSVFFHILCFLFSLYLYIFRVSLQDWYLFGSLLCLIIERIVFFFINSLLIYQTRKDLDNFTPHSDTQCSRLSN